ncbi:uncharacterized protein LOC142177497 [Nicotiana tabacum]|uniref:Uncharacterized protein LOC142177497 n=1 Tax=Nicotiana tabacum TaxID=4097 RepID=A0AC58TZ75_TOBAC
MLNPPPNPRLWNECSSNIHEESKTIISHIKSVLVFQLTSGSIKNVEDTAKCANNAFFSLDILDADYTSFYKDVNDFIAYHFDLLTTKRQREMQSFPELKTGYEDAISRAKGHKDEIFGTQDDMVMVMKKKKTFERQKLEAMELIGRLKQWVDVLKQNEEALKHKKQKCVADHVIASLKVQNLHTQVEAAKDVLREIDQRENAARNGIESATCRLKSLQS